jgi:pyruvate,water dikinase
MARFRQMRPPRVITSDGEIPVVRHASAHLPEGALPGAGVSAGVIEGVARVVLDPQKERLRPGEILVAPFTDPGWTPLFIHAAGLVTEVGGMMTHGSVVAREYGIPAVVGVLDATRSIQSGQRIRVDGDLGYVTILQAEQAPPIERVPS